MIVKICIERNVVEKHCEADFNWLHKETTYQGACKDAHLHILSYLLASHH